MCGGTRVSFDFGVGFSITVAEKGVDGTYCKFYQVPLVSAGSIEVQAETNTFDIKGDELLS
jgi:hypothetical protein